MSLKVLQCFLSQTFKTDETISTNEYNILRFTILKLVYEINQSLVSTFERMIPLEDGMVGNYDDIRNLYKKSSKVWEILPDVAKKLKPLIEFIDLRRIDLKDMENIFEPLDIISKEDLLEFFRYHAKVKTPISYTRGMPFFTWDKKHCGDGITIHNDEVTFI
ncbi:8086_t:CDS:2 [Funneliformis caledonium]|uniref:8086_t:CDS:1 n=1 Tax=Funneliformis caledonium TaxID=1117310 RepID=A0A9N9GI16_9GLOM|nr:8086_t:CDS:2 [Funneliformis caledonium]